MADQPRPSIEIYDLDEAFKKINQLEATNDYLRRRYDELHTAYRQQEQDHDNCKMLNIQKQGRIEELEEEVHRLRGREVVSEWMPSKTMTAEDRKRLEDRKREEDEIGWKLWPKWMETREMRLREEKSRAQKFRDLRENERLV
ncbi:hypothetical protein N431DRAFT_458681 [Stipitochalara longipes BDJ]|nr:hypothetical protein N431DRAFT_458681 [Stipitochalara longipes BDJ]